MKIFIVVPAFNEEARIGKFLHDLSKTKFPTIVVDDGSNDGTYIVSSKLMNNQSKKRSHSKFIVLRHKVNLGKGAAMKTGAEAAFRLGAEAVIFMDGDGQHDVRDIRNFIEKLQDFDVVFGERSKSKHIRVIGSRFSGVLTKVLFGFKLKDLLCGYRAITKNAYNKIKWNSSDYGVETEMVVRVAKKRIRYTIVPVKSIYHDIYKGFTLFDGFKILYNIVYWKLTI